MHNKCVLKPLYIYKTKLRHFCTNLKHYQRQTPWLEGSLCFGTCTDHTNTPTHVLHTHTQQKRVTSKHASIWQLNLTVTDPKRAAKQDNKSIQSPGMDRSHTHTHTQTDKHMQLNTHTHTHPCVHTLTHTHTRIQHVAFASNEVLPHI